MIFSPFTRAKTDEIASVREELLSASQSLQATSYELVKTLDEMLEETNRANRYGERRAGYHVSVTHPDKDH